MKRSIQPSKYIPFMIAHLGCLLVVFTGASWTAVTLAVVLYFVRMFAITGGLHRYFSHRTYKTSRGFQTVLAFVATSAGQMGPLWWAAHHRDHHRYSDTEDDIHSPQRHGFFWAHMGWVLDPQNDTTKVQLVKDWAKYPELVWLNKHFRVPPIALAIFCFSFGWFFGSYLGLLETTGLQCLGWGFFISTTALYHATFTINSISHVWGTRSFQTSDSSRNNFLLALITLGEGWHNNHHRFPNSEKHGLRWWQVDITHYIIRLFELSGLVWDVKVAKP